MIKIGFDFGHVIKYAGGEAVPDAYHALQSLSYVFGNEMYIISRVYSMDVAPQTMEWLKAKQIVGTIIPEANVHFCLLREEKAPIAEKLGLTHFVDDRTEVLFHMTSVTNRFAFAPTPDQLRDFPPFGMITAGSWGELLPLILKTLKSESPQSG